jgi:hypothetical protein
MNKHPMLSVKEAAQIMGCDERWVRERLNQGQLKGEKKNIGLKEKWFVYAGEVEAIVARKGSAPIMASSQYVASTAQPPEANNVTNGAVSNPVVVEATWDDEEESQNAAQGNEEERLAWLENQRQAIVELAEEMMRPLIGQLEERSSLLKQKEEALQAATYQLGYAQGRLQEQEEKIKLLPDYQARAEKAEILHQEVEVAKARAAELEENLIQVERARKEEIERISREKEQAVEILLAKAREREEEASILTQENERLKQKAEEATLNAAKLEQLKKEIQDLKQPKPSWWKKWFAPVPLQETK